MVPGSAYVTLVTNDDFVVGALALGEMLKLVGSRHKFVVATGPAVSNAAETIVTGLGYVVHRLSVANSFSNQLRNQGWNRWNSTTQKLHIIGLERFEKIVFLDADVAVLNNRDYLFQRPHLSAVRTRGLLQIRGKGQYGFNSGVMVLAPNSTDYERCLAQLPKTAQRMANEDKPWGDQDVFNDVFPDWGLSSHLHLDDGYNVFWGSIDETIARRGFSSKGSVQDKYRISVVHFTGPHKPWDRKAAFALKSIARPLRHLNRPPTREAMSILLNYFKVIARTKRRIRQVMATNLHGRQ